MTDFDFNKELESVEKEFNLGKGEYFKAQEGANRVRLVSKPLPHDSVYQGKPQFKWLCQVLDRKDGKVKPYFMPHTIYRMIADLQNSEDYRFKTIPMPFDITINATGAGTKEVKYSITPARSNVELTAEEMNLVTAAPTVEELQEKIRENESKVTTQPETPEAEKEPEVDVSDIPF